jgi:hypothetical protein
VEAALPPDLHGFQLIAHPADYFSFQRNTSLTHHPIIDDKTGYRIQMVFFYFSLGSHLSDACIDSQDIYGVLYNHQYLPAHFASAPYYPDSEHQSLPREEGKGMSISGCYFSPV